ncbi:MAG: AAA family ATPase [Proteobacteria bacterium]|nr:AAA family ATPase [Pseudomonadota bacterium]MBU1060086.1 AAA family ATPase [Pseudomonadota bacterium]
MKQQLPFAITRIRLINFHNFVDETISIPDSGHLFLLGDNGCGKTTVLDAIHYVLTAGRSMEWNSAARVTGRRDGGRRLQGVILRYNMETGVMNQQGSITYAAIEIAGRNGQPLTIGLGMSVAAMDEKVNPWGVIRECPLEEIPFLIDDDHGRRPASRREFKQALGNSRGFYRDATTFRRELAGRLFGGTDSYQEICRFLSMGKAYREIAAGAADYHELFKQLLPEPHTTLFEQIIDGLRTLDSSRTLLDDLERKVDYVRSLQELITNIDRQQEAICRYDWLLCRWNLKTNQKEQHQNEKELTRLGLKQQEGEARLHALQRQDQQLHERLADLKAKDNSGLVRQEKSCKGELQEKKAKLAIHVSRLKNEKKVVRQAELEQERQHRELTDRLGKVISECGRRARNLPFSITSLQQEVDQLFRTPDVDRCSQLEGQETFATIKEHLHTLNGQSVLLEKEIDRGAAELSEQEKLLETLRKQETPQPQQDIFSCIRAMQNEMIIPKPLYLGLEWFPGLDLAEQGRIEEVIGEEVLVTLIIADNDYPTCRTLITDWPGMRISCKSRAAEDLPEWMRSVFDIQNSDPDALRCLAAEMESSREPVVSRLNNKNLLAFRSHERTLFGKGARLIGTESRRQALAEEISVLETEISRLAQKQLKQEKELKRIEGQKELLENFRVTLSDLLKEIGRLAHQLTASQKETNHCRDRYRQQKERHDELESEVEHLAIRYQELTELIAQEGLAGLDRRISSLESQWRTNRDTINKENQQLGALNSDSKQSKERQKRLAAEYEALQVELNQKTGELASRLPDIEDIAYYVLKTKTGQQFSSSAAIIKKREEAERDAISLILELKKVKLNDPEFGATFRFSYTETANQVQDFRGRLLSDILPEQEQAVREQQELINDHTRELFTKIIMTDLMTYLRSHVSSLEQMIRRINSLLAHRSFGGQRYRFRVRPLENFRRLVEVVKKFSPFDPKADKEVRHFFEDHRNDIMAAEVGAVPEELDYRNWYRYELEVSSVGEQGVVMDRTTKSIGSGGEQAVPNYLLILTIAHFLYRGKKVRLHTLLFDEAFYGIDAGRRDQLLGFATDLDLQLFVASPDQDGVRREIKHSTTLFVVKDKDFNVHLRDFHWENPNISKQPGLFDGPQEEKPIVFGEEL